MLMLGLLMAALVGAPSPSVQTAGDASLASGEAAQSLAQAEVGSPPVQTDPVDPKRAVRAAWDKARDAGSYAFATNLVRITYPAWPWSTWGAARSGGNYHITLSSAAINQGVNAGVGTDIDGQPRPYGWGYDIGADELVRDVVPGVDSFSAVVSGTQILLE